MPNRLESCASECEHAPLTDVPRLPRRNGLVYAAHPIPSMGLSAWAWRADCVRVPIIGTSTSNACRATVLFLSSSVRALSPKEQIRWVLAGKTRRSIGNSFRERHELARF